MPYCMRLEVRVPQPPAPKEIVMDIVSLDLHGVRHEDARPKVIRFIEQYWGKGVEAEIVTGHSAKMRGLVMNILEEYDLSYNIGRLFDVHAPMVITWLE